MKKTLPFVVLAIALMVTCTSITSAQPTEDDTDARVAASMRDLQQFHATQSLDELHVAVSSLLSALPPISMIAPQNYIARRRTVVEAWARIFGTIEQFKDPTFDPNNPNNVPEVCVAPPREPNGVQLPSCVDPRGVQDPTARAEYIEAILANDLKAQRSNFQLRLRTIDDEAMLAIRQNLATFRGVSPDFVALDAILREAGLTQERRSKIDAMIGAPTNDQTNARVASSLQGLQRFHATNSLDDLEATVDSLGSALILPDVAPTDYVARRRTLVQAWTQVFVVY